MPNKANKPAVDESWSTLYSADTAHLPADGSKGAVVVGDDRPFVPKKSGQDAS